MSFIADAVLDAALQKIETDCENLYICSAEPTTFAEASATYALGSKAAPTFTGPVPGDLSGRKTTIDEISDGEVSDTDTATHWALTDDSEEVLLVVGDLTAPQVVTLGNAFTLTAIDITIPAPAVV